jgi:hypothetical protein
MFCLPVQFREQYARASWGINRGPILRPNLQSTEPRSHRLSEDHQRARQPCVFGARHEFATKLQSATP